VAKDMHSFNTTTNPAELSPRLKGEQARRSSRRALPVAAIVIWNGDQGEGKTKGSPISRPQQKVGPVESRRGIYNKGSHAILLFPSSSRLP
jgi:hypothetical protein